MQEMNEVVHARVLDGYRIQVTFRDGVSKVVDLETHLWGPVFEPLRDPARFREVAVEDGTVRWPNGADLDPEVLYYGGAPPWSQEKKTSA